MFHFLFAEACSEDLCREGFSSSCIVVGAPSVKLSSVATSVPCTSATCTRGLVLSRTTVAWEEGLSAEELPPSDKPLGTSVGHFLD